MLSSKVSYFVSIKTDNGLINNKKNNPIIKIAIAIGLKISKIEYPKFRIETNSLLLIKFLIKNVILIMIMKGIISFKIDGYFRKERCIKIKTPLLFSGINLESSNKFIKNINIEMIIKFMNIYLFAK